MFKINIKYGHYQREVFLFWSAIVIIGGIGLLSAWLMPIIMRANTKAKKEATIARIANVRHYLLNEKKEINSDKELSDLIEDAVAQNKLNPNNIYDSWSNKLMIKFKNDHIIIGSIGENVLWETPDSMAINKIKCGDDIVDCITLDSNK